MVAREMTKVYEEIYRGTITEVLEQLRTGGEGRGNRHPGRGILARRSPTCPR